MSSKDHEKQVASQAKTLADDYRQTDCDRMIRCADQWNRLYCQMHLVPRATIGTRVKRHITRLLTTIRQ